MSRQLRYSIFFALVSAMVLSTGAQAQTSSIGVKHRQEEEANPPETPPREAAKPAANPVYLKYAWTTSPPEPPKEYRPGDLLTVVVRQKMKYEADADLKTESTFGVNTEFEAFAKIVDGGLGPVTWSRGKPNVDVKYDDTLEKKGDTKREDQLTTRLTAKIIDVKPNGQLVIEGRASVKHDDEESTITITGICRKEDVSADNSVLSTQIADVHVCVTNKGALRNAAKRGWLTKFFDAVKPF